MRYSRMAIVTTSGLLLLAACGGGGGQNSGGTGQVAMDPGTSVLTSNDPGSPGMAPVESGQQKIPSFGTDSTCQRPHKGEMPTPPIVTITVTGNSIHLDPDPVVQPVAVGYFGWQLGSPDITVAQVHFKAGPLPSDTYVIPPHRAVGGPIRKDAACQDYKYTVTVLLPDTVLTVDPHGRVY